MKGNKRLPALAACIVLSLGLAAAEPWARIVYAEGSSFNLVRSGKVLKKEVASADVIGFELASGDILQTASSTFLELYIYPVSASVQIAENTSFRCESDGTGTQTKGELYYGRVRAKVAKLSGSNSFRISSPSLVAGVRGTDFGLDVISMPIQSVQTGPAGESASGPAAVPSSGSAAVPASGSAILSRVFCFEGSVAVAPVKDTASLLVLVEGGEMVERQLTKLDSGSEADQAPLEKKPISDQVSGFWSERPVIGPDLSEAASSDAPSSEALSAAGEDGDAVAAEGQVPEEPVLPVFSLTDAVALPNGIIMRDILFRGFEDESKMRRNLRIPGAATAILMTAGSFCSIGAAYWAEYQDPEEVLVAPVHSAGLAMIGSAAILSILSALVP